MKMNVIRSYEKAHKTNEKSAIIDAFLIIFVPFFSSRRCVVKQTLNAIFARERLLCYMCNAVDC